MFDKILKRVIRVIKFDKTVYKEIEEDEGANTEVAIVVVVASLLAAIGAGIGGRSALAFIVSLVAGVALNWLLWSFVTMFVGTRLFQGQTNFWEMARCLGYAAVPRVLGILGAIACLGAIAGVVGWVLSLVLAFFAAREALDLSTERTLITLGIGWVVVLVINIVFGTLFAFGAAFI